MAKVYIDSWLGFKMKSDPKKIGVHAEWNLTAQKVLLKSASNASLADEVVFEYEISVGTITGRVKTTDYVFLNTNSDDLAAVHKIKIKSYESSNLEDDESMITAEAPTL